MKRTLETSTSKVVRLAISLAALALLVAAPLHAASGKLVGTVGPGFTITLQKNGTKVTKLKAGRYAITVDDRSSAHNFHLSGPGVNKKTSISGTGTVRWTVTLQPGKTYRFVCDPHASAMNGSFRTAG